MTNNRDGRKQLNQFEGRSRDASAYRPPADYFGGRPPGPDRGEFWFPILAMSASIIFGAAVCAVFWWAS